MDFYNKELKAVFRNLNSSENGLSNEEAENRLKQYGLNELREEKKVLPLKIFLRQFKSLLIWILVAAVLVSAFIGDYVESIVILIIILANAVIGFVQEYKAERAIAALKKLSGPKAVVLRDNKKMSITADQLVPGDIIFLEAGDKIPADARLIKTINLEAQESTLTGESVPVQKQVCTIKKAEVAEQKNMVFAWTSITRGRAKAIITGTAMNTEIGKIAKMISDVEETTPLQLKIDAFAKYLGIAVLFICAIIFSMAVFNGGDILEMFKIAISLAVAAVPEGLPAVVTLSLALSVQKMAKRNALIRKLPAVETLGSVTVIGSDKTGTLTCDQMTVKKLFVDNEVIDVTGEGYSFEGSFSKELGENAQFLLKTGALCNDTEINGINKEVIGDPTEAALIVSAAKAGFKKRGLEELYQRIDELPFDSERKRMSTIHEVHGKRVMYTKGAVDVILNLCTKVMIKGKIEKLTKKHKERILKANKEFASSALRVLGFAFKEVKGKPSEKDLVFIGMQAMIDPARPEVMEAVSQCKKAGIRVIMITGDHKETAVAIAKQIGIEGKAVTGEELNKIKELSRIINEVSIYARVNPAHKIKIIEALKKKRQLVAMTGDGVNDAPALKKADIGIAMGKTGTDVAKEASDIVLVDDNFASIRNAVEEGRAVFNDLKKFVFFLLSSNFSEILIIFIAILICLLAKQDLKLPLIAIQILWVNLVTDGLPALALGVEKPEKDIMLRKPRRYGEHIVNKAMIMRLLMISAIITAGTLYLFFWALQKNGYIYATTIAFTSLVIFEMFNAINSKSEDKSSILRLFTNKWLLLAITSSIILQVMVIYTPLSSAFHTVQLNFMDWVIIIAVASSVLILDELRKITARFINRD